MPIFQWNSGLFEYFKSLYDLELHSCPDYVIFLWFQSFKWWYWPPKWHKKKLLKNPAATKCISGFLGRSDKKMWENRPPPKIEKWLGSVFCSDLIQATVCPQIAIRHHATCCANVCVTLEVNFTPSKFEIMKKITQSCQKNDS